MDDCLELQSPCHLDGVPICCSSEVGAAVCTVLNGHPTGFCTSTATGSKSEPFSIVTWFIVGVSLILLILLAVISFFLWSRHRKKKENTSQVQGKSLTCIELELQDVIIETSSNVEVQATDFSIEHSKILGSGHFSVVLLAFLRGTPVAAKTVRAGIRGQHQEHLLGLVHELKTLIRIGSHANIVSLLGAYTEGLCQTGVAGSSGHFYVFLEFCANGSLDKFITRVRPPTSGTTVYIPVDLAGRIEKWCVQISAGMAYLASRHIIHGDLATRNVLLTTDLVAKISDFGLSRKLYTYITGYVQQSEDVPLPWQHMAPEALTHLRFSTPSDVWAFGVTLWQIYSLEEVPYVSLGINYGPEFVQGVCNGTMRLQKPVRAPDPVYELLQDCWALEPDSRPSFEEVHERLVVMATLQPQPHVGHALHHVEPSH